MADVILIVESVNLTSCRLKAVATMTASERLISSSTVNFFSHSQAVATVKVNQHKSVNVVVAVFVNSVQIRCFICREALCFKVTPNGSGLNEVAA